MKLFDVLIVEDDKALSEALCDTLELEGYQVLAAQNGTEALGMMASNRFRLVVSDVQMPVMDGIELLSNLQRMADNIPVLLMTAYGSIEKAVAAIQSGAADYLLKPFEAKSLVDKVASLLVDAPKLLEDNQEGDEKMQQLYALAAKVAKSP